MAAVSCNAERALSGYHNVAVLAIARQRARSGAHKIFHQSCSVDAKSAAATPIKDRRVFRSVANIEAALTVLKRSSNPAK
ncbi:hypothetical protein AB7M49_005143 [Bradyrhizobium elkanii]|uniref:Uncharacterized protein n=1 Tax=Bradyrhizobium elkanii TaxID=29448 RepID=A0ABV4EWZ7_BRAEL|nr:hypothetical protein [Bradyrhizobium elkanii]MCP1756597.1 hypothetical protein [Bradyrhizobium elkanii]MCP1982110.1 hypothetical protein [Bradyrhizobium elkanii]MCS3883106.1 hypothetical protein [Bradyrhizobium elkanii]MCS4217837.1 hypothetical protein [Bradyrhizobium elkanii]MCW2195713.1 hypothetical protein [Bradyrhizobium elkanii]